MKLINESMTNNNAMYVVGYLAGGDTATWVGLCDLNNSLLSVKVLLCSALSQLPLSACGSGFNHKLQQASCSSVHITWGTLSSMQSLFRLLLLHTTQTAATSRNAISKGAVSANLLLNRVVLPDVCLDLLDNWPVLHLGEGFGVTDRSLTSRRGSGLQVRHQQSVQP